MAPQSEFEPLREHLRNAYREANEVRRKWQDPEHPLYQHPLAQALIKIEEAMHWVEDAETSVG